MFWNNSCTFYNYLKRPARLSPSSWSSNRFFRRTVSSIHSCFIFQKTLRCKQKQRWRLLSLFSREINYRMYQIYKEDGVVNRVLTPRRHFWTPWSEWTHYMENGQSVFFSLASPALRIRACEAHALALALLLPYSKPILGKKTDCFAVYRKLVVWTFTYDFCKTHDTDVVCS